MPFHPEIRETGEGLELKLDILVVGVEGGWKEQGCDRGNEDAIEVECQAILSNHGSTFKRRF
jgi:hypothetical protein